MTATPRHELQAMVDHWLAANRECEAAGDWGPLADLYTEDATYGWNYGPDREFMAVGREEIRSLALGEEMGGLDGWTYPYQRILLDEAVGEVVGFWRQLADVTQPDGSPYEVAGIGGSWFRYGGNMRWSWQRDWFDLGNATACFIAMYRAGVLSDGMTARMHKDPDRPGWYPIATAPAGLWDGVVPGS